MQTDADAGWGFVLENLNVHCSVTLVGYVAEQEGIDCRQLDKPLRIPQAQNAVVLETFKFSQDTAKCIRRA